MLFESLGAPGRNFKILIDRKRGRFRNENVATSNVEGATRLEALKATDGRSRTLDKLNVVISDRGELVLYWPVHRAASLLTR